MYLLAKYNLMDEKNGEKKIIIIIRELDFMAKDY